MNDQAMSMMGQMMGRMMAGAPPGGCPPPNDGWQAPDDGWGKGGSAPSSDGWSNDGWGKGGMKGGGGFAMSNDGGWQPNAWGQGNANAWGALAPAWGAPAPAAWGVAPRPQDLPLLPGTITRGQDRFGYLKQDNGEKDLFLLPRDCEAFGKQIPPKGTRVLYAVGIDEMKGRPKAMNVQPDPNASQYEDSGAYGAAGVGIAQRNGPYGDKESYNPTIIPGQILNGMIAKGQDRFGYLKQDSGEPDLFVLPGDCVGFAEQGIPAKGTRVLYCIGLDDEKGRPKAVQVQPDAANEVPQMLQNGQQFGVADSPPPPPPQLSFAPPNFGDASQTQFQFAPISGLPGQQL